MIREIWRTLFYQRGPRGLPYVVEGRQETGFGEFIIGLAGDLDQLIECISSRLLMDQCYCLVILK